MLPWSYVFTNYCILACCVGHEIVGKTVRVGSNVKNITLGDRVGVGAQSLSCLQPECPACSAREEMTCNNVNVCQTLYFI